MFAAVLTTVLFALSGVTGQRVAIRLGGVRGNVVRLFLAAVVLGAIVLTVWPESLRREPFAWFFLSGLVGFGFGDVALFLAFERLGSRLTILLTLCLAPLFAMALEWIWLGNGLTLAESGCAFLILVGVTLAIRPGAGSRQVVERRGRFGVGIVAGVAAALGQGAGAVISRKAEAVVAELGMTVSGMSAAFQRVFAGLVFGVIAMLVLGVVRGSVSRGDGTRLSDPGLAPWLIGAALAGPVLGVSCFQWALQSLESGLVLAVVATTPIVMMPMAALTEGDRPSRLAVVGAILAVAGVALLYARA